MKFRTFVFFRQVRVSRLSAMGENVAKFLAQGVAVKAGADIIAS